MMDVKDILAHYTQLRTEGIDIENVLDTLSDEIEMLDVESKQRLVRQMRAYEAGETLKGDLETASAPSNLTTRDANQTLHNILIQWITCPNCGKGNQKSDLICYNCGYLLVENEMQTQHLVDNAPNQPSQYSDYFAPNAVLVLTVHDSPIKYEIRPQSSRRELILGRKTNSAMTPDVDLSNADANRLGVSRMHLTMRYDERSSTVSVFDMGSANGSFVNGQRLHPHEVRVLHHNDELRLGHLQLIVTFRERETS